MFKLEFNSDNGNDRYEICVQSFILTNRVPQLSEYDDVVGVLRKLKSIGRPTNVAQGKQLYDLQAGGGAIELERSERNLLLEHVKHPMWLPFAIEQVVDTRKWIEGLGEEKPLELAK